MSDTLLLLFTVGIAFVLAEFARKADIKHTSWSVTLFAVLGFACGPNALEFFNAETLNRFDLLIGLLIGVVGFILGIEFRHATRARAFVAGSVVSATSVFLLISAVFVLAFAFHFPVEKSMLDSAHLEIFFPDFIGELSLNIYRSHLWMGMAMGAIFVCPSMMSNQGLSKFFEAKGVSVPRVLQVSAIFESLAVLFFGLTLAAGRAVGSATELNLTVTEWGVIAIFSGLVCGILFTLFIGRDMEPQTLFLATIGAVTFSSGLGHVLGISPLFVNLIFGYTVALFSQQSLKMKREFDRLLRPLSIILFFFAGAYWAFSVLDFFFVLGAYLILRPFMFKAMPYFFFKRILLDNEKPAATVGEAMISQDHIAVAMALAFQQRFPEMGQVLISVTLIGIFLSQIIGPIWLRRWFVNQGAIDLKG